MLSSLDRTKMVLNLSKKTKLMELVLNDKVDVKCDLVD
jgi:hypothetical protein